MELIRKLGTRKFKHYKRSYGLFKCPFCGQEVEKYLFNGINQRSCGCNIKKQRQKRLTIEEVYIIRKHYSSKKHSLLKLSEIYGVTISTISDIVKNKIYI